MDKICSKCKIHKDANKDFYFDVGRNKSRADCKTCRTKTVRKWRKSNKNNCVKTERKWYHADKDRAKDVCLRRDHSLTLNEYNELLEKQARGCAICKQSESALSSQKNKKIKRLAVDHCHKTKKIRGLLCDNCNKGLGMYKDSISLLEAVIEYLRNNSHE